MTVDRNCNCRRDAFTLTELLVVIGIIALLAAILVPVFFNVRENAHQTTCLSNTRQLASALTLYAQDSDGYFPTHPDKTVVGPTVEWDMELSPYVRSSNVFCCPDCSVPATYANNPNTISKGYALNIDMSGAYDGSHPSANDAAVHFPATTITLCEVSFQQDSAREESGVTVTTNTPDNGESLESGESYIGPPGAVRHHGGSNYAFADGHARWYRPQQIISGGTTDGRKVTNNGTDPSFAL